VISWQREWEVEPFPTTRKSVIFFCSFGSMAWTQRDLPLLLYSFSAVFLLTQEEWRQKYVRFSDCIFFCAVAKCSSASQLFMYIISSKLYIVALLPGKI
jgi:hypothetical protein